MSYFVFARSLKLSQLHLQRPWLDSRQGCRFQLPPACTSFGVQSADVLAMYAADKDGIFCMTVHALNFVSCRCVWCHICPTGANVHARSKCIHSCLMSFEMCIRWALAAGTRR